MGGRKLRLSTHRKNAERTRQKKTLEEAGTAVDTTLSISLPLATYCEGIMTSLGDLTLRLTKCSCLPSSWIVASTNPLLLCKLTIHQGEIPSTRASLSLSLSVHEDFGWSASVANKPLTSFLCRLLSNVPDRLASVSAVCQLVSTLDTAKLCCGNDEPMFLEQWRHRGLTLHGSTGKITVALQNCTND